MSNLRVVIAQLNLHVGDIEYNLQKHIEAAKTAKDDFEADLIVFPELSLTGYPAEDLFLRTAFIDAADRAFEKLLIEVQGIYCLVGHPWRSHLGLHNGCSLIYNGQILGQYAKQHLPNYGVFDEARYFVKGEAPCIVAIKDIPIGLVICEDVWFPGPTQQAVMQGAKLILSPNASPFEVNKHELRVKTLSERAKKNQCSILYVNQVGGQDELVFDGGSMFIDERGKLVQLAGFFSECLHPFDVSLKHSATSLFDIPKVEEKIYQAITLGVRDYVHKNNFTGVLLGLSGGIDSALTLAIAHDALGSDHVHAILMPSQFTADISIEDALLLANNLNIRYDIFPIESVYEEFLQTLKFNDDIDVTAQNIQSRCRAIILMALSNKYCRLVLTTGNRSELAVGYCTLYGDMAGAYAPLKDLYKTEVYALANYRNQITPVIPERILHRPPTAELAPNQKDQDILPPYEMLDAILKNYLNSNLSAAQIIQQGYDAAIVHNIIELVRKNEYKRKQSAMGPHIRHQSFGKDWRYPITNGFKG